MDPNANLREQLALSRVIIKDEGEPSDAYELAELVLALDKWLRNGGFLPDRWEIGQKHGQTAR
jgi:hypothetical protein